MHFQLYDELWPVYRIIISLVTHYAALIYGVHNFWHKTSQTMYIELLHNLNVLMIAPCFILISPIVLKFTTQLTTFRNSTGLIVVFSGTICCEKRKCILLGFPFEVSVTTVQNLVLNLLWNEKVCRLSSK